MSLIVPLLENALSSLRSPYSTLYRARVLIILLFSPLVKTNSHKHLVRFVPICKLKRYVPIIIIYNTT